MSGSSSVSLSDSCVYGRCTKLHIARVPPRALVMGFRLAQQAGSASCSKCSCRWQARALASAVIRLDCIRPVILPVVNQHKSVAQVGVLLKSAALWQ
jgi:hypothetical protein